jgi:hypothetical protein
MTLTLTLDLEASDPISRHGRGPSELLLRWTLNLFSINNFLNWISFFSPKNKSVGEDAQTGWSTRDVRYFVGCFPFFSDTLSFIWGQEEWVFETGPCYVDQDGPELMILLPQLPRVLGLQVRATVPGSYLSFLTASIL